MKIHPVILVSTEVEDKGREFGDFSISLSIRYEQALLAAGGLPWIVPSTNSPALIAEVVARCQGVMLTGGDDVAPDLYDPEMPAELKEKARVTPDGGRRDHRELLLIQQALRQGKPLLAICRGQQVLNVALGGTLIPDLPTCRPGPIDHRRMDKRCEVVHDVQLTPDSLLSKIFGGMKAGVNSTHHQCVAKLAPGLRVTATSPDGIAEAIELEPAMAGKAPFLLGVQFHPERLEDRYREHGAIFREFVNACRNT
jgi:putative glutamine amidotransferase